MDIKALRYFLTIAQFGSITRAAIYLSVAQPALSRQIRKLETDLGVQLLHRSARGVLLTEAGKRLAARAGGILSQIDRVRAETQSCGDNPAGPVSVALMPAVGSMIAPDLVRSVREQFPEVRLTLSEGLTSFIGEGLISEGVDLGLFHAEKNDPAFAITPLLTEPMFLVGPGMDCETGGTSSKRGITLAELASYPLLLPSRPNALRLMIDRLASAQQVQLDIREDVDSSSIIKRLVGAGLGYTIQCYSYVHEEVSRGDLSVRRLTDAGLSRDWSLARLRDRPQAPAVVAVGRAVEEIVAGLAKARKWQQPRGQ
ncbi:MAG: LysR family transcriptional regulator [Methyloligellaceae bacterium]